MSEAAFSLHVSQALDRLDVPMLPTGFADRLAARIASGDLSDEAGVADLASPMLRRPIGTTGWRRSGRILAVAVTFGLATATAAAAGVFGDPIYIPVVSQALARTELVKMPIIKPVSKTDSRPLPTGMVATKQPVAEQPSGRDLVVKLITDMQFNSSYRALTRDQRFNRMDSELRALVASGKVTGADIRAAHMQLAAEREARKTVVSRQNRSELKKFDAELKRRLADQRAKPLTPEQKEKVRDAVNQLTEAQRAELQVLRQRRREATLQERRAVQGEIRAFWQRVGVEPTAENAANEAP